MRIPVRIPFVLAAVLLAGPADALQDGENLLLVIADDVGMYELPVFGEALDPIPTPTIDQLAAEGVAFPNCYANPLCTPSRATILTGRYALQTGCGALLTLDWGLQPEEVTVAEAIADSPFEYARGLFGKWHLTNWDGGGYLGPNLAGFDHAEWTVHNLNPPRDTYFHWEEIENGQLDVREGYVTSHVVDRALEWIESVQGPWFVTLSFHAGHDPFHAPPSELHTQELQHLPPGQIRPYYKAMVEALDTELGRFLEALGPDRERTNVIFVGDNGSPPPVIGPPGTPPRSKGSIYEGGINVPLIVAGPAVTAPGSVSTALVNTTDLFATMLDLAGVPLSSLAYEGLELSSVSILPYLSDPAQPSIRSIVYSDLFYPGGFAATEYVGAVRDQRYKLIAHYPPLSYEFYDLQLDPLEGTNLMGTALEPGAQAAFQTLQADLLQKMTGYFP